MIKKLKNVAATVFNRKPKNEFCYMSTYKYWRNFSWVNEADIVTGDTGLKQAFDRDISNNDEKAYSFFLGFFF